MANKQLPLLEEQAQHDYLSELIQRWEDLTGSLKEYLGTAEGFMRLLRDGPKTSTDIFFRCGDYSLSGQHLGLLAKQAQELSTTFLLAQERVVELVMLAPELNELRKLVGEKNAEGAKRLAELEAENTTYNETWANEETGFSDI